MVKKNSVASSLKPVPLASGRHWLLRHAGPYLEDPLGFLMKTWRTHGDVYMLDLLKTKSIIFNHPKHAYHILQTNHQNYNKSDGYRPLQRAFGPGLIMISGGETWLRQRRIAQPAFHRANYGFFAEQMLEIITAMLERWERDAKAGRTVDLASEMLSVTSEIVAQTLFGSDLGQNLREIETAFKNLNAYAFKGTTMPFMLPTWIPTRTNRSYLKSKRFLNQIVDRIINQRLRSSVDHQDLLQLLINARYEDTGEGMTQEQIRHEVMNIFFAGHETSANALTFALWQLIKEPEIKEKITAEVEQVFDSSVIGLEQVAKLRFTLQVIKETMRLYPPAPFLSRQSVQSDEIDGYLVPAGIWVGLSPFVIHRHPDAWSNPETFNPDRFLPENEASIPKLAYFPFAAGPRKCMGDNFALLQMPMILAMICHRFSLIPIPDFNPQIAPMLTLHLKPGLPVHLEKRTA